MKLCSVDGCGKIHVAKGFCDKHYYRMRRGIDITNGSTRYHGMTKTPEWHIWKDMLQRCRNKNSPYFQAYGGRGICVCKKWEESFVQFFKDMGNRPKGKQLDRIDNNLGYSPENCRWATPEENGQNRRTCKLKIDDVISIFNSSETNTALSKKYGVSRSTIIDIKKRKKWKNVTENMMGVS